MIENTSDFKIDLNAGTLNKISDFATDDKKVLHRCLMLLNPFDLGEHIANTSGILRDLRTMMKHPRLSELLRVLFRS